MWFNGDSTFTLAVQTFNNASAAMVEFPNSKSNAEPRVLLNSEQVSKEEIQLIISNIRSRCSLGLALVMFDAADLSWVNERAVEHGITPLRSDEVYVVDPRVVDRFADSYRAGASKNTLWELAEIYGVQLPKERTILRRAIIVDELAKRMARLYVPDMQVEVETLTSLQRIWQKRWADSRNEWMSARGYSAKANPSFPF